MHDFHGDKAHYFNITKKVTQEYILPFLQESIPLSAPIDVLEIGCGEAGVLQAFTDLGHQAFGIELEESRLEHARKFMAKELAENKVAFLNRNIYDVDVEKDIGKQFDLVILKDVIEHIPGQEAFIPELHRFLKPGGSVFFAFPPWQMPYGGHQQVLPGKLASKLPWYHLLPGPLYKVALKLFGVNPSGIKTMFEIKSTGISIERFQNIVKKSDFSVVQKRFFLFNPIYKYKFGINPRKQLSLVSAIPYLRNFVTMGVYFLVKRTK